MIKRISISLAVMIVVCSAFIGVDRLVDSETSVNPTITVTKAEPIKVKPITKPAKPAKIAKDDLHKSVELIKNFEGFSANAIPDSNGYQIGYGLNYINGKKVKQGQTITRETAEYHLRKTILENRKAYANVVDPNYINIVDSMVYQFGPGITKPNKLLGKNIRKTKFNCEVIKQYRFVGKKDCSIHNSCKGVWERAKQTYDMCVEINKQV